MIRARLPRHGPPSTRSLQAMTSCTNTRVTKGITDSREFFPGRALPNSVPARFKTLLHVIQIALPDHLIAQVAVPPQTESETRQTNRYPGQSMTAQHRHRNQ